MLLCNAYAQTQTSARYCLSAGRFIWANSAFCLWVAATDLICWYFGSGFSGAILSGILLCGLGVVAVAVLRWKTIMETLFASDRSAEGRIHACSAMLALRNRCLRDKVRSNNFELGGFFLRHAERCNIPQCPVTKLIARGRVDPVVHRSEMLETMLYSINWIMKRLIQEQPRSLPAKLFFVSTIISVLKFNHILAWEMHKHARFLAPNPVERFVLYCQK